MTDPVTPFAYLAAHIVAEFSCANVGNHRRHKWTRQHHTLLTNGVPVDEPVDTRFFDIKRLTWADDRDGTIVATKCLQCGGADVGDFDAPRPSREAHLHILMPRIETRKQGVINVAGQYHQQVDVTDVVVGEKIGIAWE